MKNGFTLIELLIASTIATLLTGLLFFSFNQTSKLIPKLDSYDDVYSKAIMLNTQLERDLSGAFVPNEYYARQKKEKEARAQKPEAEKKETDEQTKKNAAQQPVPEEKKEQKPLEKLFYGVSKDGMLDYVTFITSNPLGVYWSSKTGAPRPRVVRVVYRLKEEKNKNAKEKKSYQLIRQESENLEFAAFDENKKEVREFVIADGIKELKVSYRAFIEPKPEDAKAGQKKEEPQKKELRTFAEWVRKTEDDKEAKEIIPLIPQLTDIKISFWDYQKKRTFPFDFLVYNRAEFPLTRKQPQQGSRLVKLISDSASQLFPVQPTNQNPPPAGIGPIAMRQHPVKGFTRQ